MNLVEEDAQRIEVHAELGFADAAGGAEMLGQGFPGSARTCGSWLSRTVGTGR
ncbi:hypothetical protein [Micromonospora sp. HM134]|uniref:hypothetical protein n=1 Tax=Micromonospora sp. HM134 TaxID=2583243 RepID=UPI00143CF67B|nr:hypothetical protein [Micromonospora sp. HM134]